MAFTGKNCGTGVHTRSWEDGWGRGLPEGSGLRALCNPPQEKCFDETRYEHLEVGDRWARVSQGQVEQCECAEGQIRCESTRHTGTPWPRWEAGPGSPSHRPQWDSPDPALPWWAPSRPEAELLSPPRSLPEQPMPEWWHLPPDRGHRDHCVLLPPGPCRAALQHW